MILLWYVWFGVEIMIRIKNINQNNADIEGGGGGRRTHWALRLPPALKIWNRLPLLRKIR